MNTLEIKKIKIHRVLNQHLGVDKHLDVKKNNGIPSQPKLERI